MIISIASGKGGTGKTTVSTNLALAIEDDVEFLDCDAEEPNAHLFLKSVTERTEKVSIPIPEIDEEKCTYCGKCREVCAYNAIAVIKPSEGRKGNILVFPNLCHGCGSCSYFCPVGAIREVDKEIGEIILARAGSMKFVYGRLNIGEAMAPPIIKKIRGYADQKKTVIIDAPPGTSCPVVASIKDSDFTLLVTEPTPFGLNDLTLAVGVLRKLKIPFGVVVNRSDLGDNLTDEFCMREKIPILMRIPFDKGIAEAYSRGIPIIERFPEYKKEFKALFNKIKEIT